MSASVKQHRINLLKYINLLYGQTNQTTKAKNLQAVKSQGAKIEVLLTKSLFLKVSSLKFGIVTHKGFGMLVSEKEPHNATKSASK